MPIDASAIGIRPVTPERPSREPDSIQRREEGTVAGFRPQTNVALRTAISDLAGTLERIATSEKFGMNKMPTEIGQIIRHVLEQSLSLQETLGKGIGSTIESQRFSMEQLSTFGRMLFQLGSLADKGFSMKISPETQVLLSQFKNLIVSAEGGNALEPVLMSKSAFELLDSKIPEQLPQVMFEILSQLAQPTAVQSNQPQQESDIMNFLNKLVKFFMPRPESDNRPPLPQNQQQPMNQGQPQQNFQQPMNQNQPQNQFQQPMNQNQPQQNFQQPFNQNQPQNNFQQPFNQNQPQNNFQQPFNQNQPQNQFQQPMNQNQPQNNFQQPMNQNQPQQNFQQPFNQNQPQNNFQQPFNQNQPQQNFQQPFNQNQPQNQFQQPMNQNQPQNNFQQPFNQNQPQNFQQPMNQNQPQNNFQQPFNQNQPQQNFQQPFNQNQPQQNFQQPFNQNQPQQNFQQPMNQNQPQNNFQQPFNQNQPQQNFQQPFNQNQPQNNFQQPFNQNQPQNNFQQPMNQNQPQNNFQQPMNQNQPQNNFQQPMNQNQPFQQNFQQPMNQNQPFQQNFQQPMNQNQPFQQNFQQPMNQNQPFQQNFQQPFNQNQPQNNFQQPMNQNQPQQTQQGQPQPQMSLEEFIAQQQNVRQQMQTARLQMLRQPMLNTPRTMDTMKDLAQFIMRNSEMSQQDTATLQNFINNPQKNLSPNEVRHLQNLMRLCQQNVPSIVRQAAIQQNLPDLPRLWAFMQMCDMARLASSQMRGIQFRRAGKDVADFANSMRKAMSGDNFTSNVQTQRSFQMMVPIYLSVNEMSYPTYLNVYDESSRDNETGIDKKETWLRICVLTDNIGAAELIFRVYEGDQLDMRFYFSQGETAGVFATYVDDLRESMQGINLQLGEIRIGSIGATMEQY